MTVFETSPETTLKTALETAPAPSTEATPPATDRVQDCEDIRYDSVRS